VGEVCSDRMVANVAGQTRPAAFIWPRWH
jgi:hypothetical protein